MNESARSEAVSNTYTIAGGDDGCYGPSFGPIRTNEVGRFGVGINECLVLRLNEPILDGLVEIELIAVRPRYQDVNFESLRKNETIVGVWLLLTPSNPSSFQAGLTEANSKYWAIGTCTPCEV